MSASSKSVHIGCSNNKFIDIVILFTSTGIIKKIILSLVVFSKLQRMNFPKVHTTDKQYLQKNFYS